MCNSQVRATGDGRGNGAFAVRPLSAGTCLGKYEGDTLDEAAYWQRYPSGVVSDRLAPLKLLSRSLCDWHTCSIELPIVHSPRSNIDLPLTCCSGAMHAPHSKLCSGGHSPDRRGVIAV